MPKEKEKTPPPIPEIDEKELESFLDDALKSAEVEDSGDVLEPLGEPSHRRLKVKISPNGMEAHLEAVFLDTTFDEVQEALRRERVVWGVQEEPIRRALRAADRTGRHQVDVLVAQGRPAVYKNRKEVTYPFLEGIQMPDSGEPVHLASSIFRDIREVIGGTDIEGIRGYGKPVVAAEPGQVLMLVQGEDVIEPGQDVFGKEVRTVSEEKPSAYKPGDGVDARSDESLVANRFGYISTVAGQLEVVCPIWISLDNMEAWFVNPPQLGEHKVPEPQGVLEELEHLGVTFGTDEAGIGEMCEDLHKGGLRESCVLVAKGRRPNLSKGQIGFTFEPLTEARFEGIRTAFQMTDLSKLTESTIRVHAVHGGEVIAEQAVGEAALGPGEDLFGQPVAPPEEVQVKKAYKPGINVRREEEEGRIRYVSEIYGYAGVLENRIMVVSPIWVSPDKMTAYFVALPQQREILPREAEVSVLIDRAKIRHGLVHEAIGKLCQAYPSDESPEDWPVVIARATPPEPGDHGTIELLYKQMPDPGRLLEGGRIDFRERDAVPQVTPGELLAKRSFPKPGKDGTDVRGKVLKPPKSERGLLYAGPNVVTEEKNGLMHFYASGAGWPRVVKDTLSVMQRFQHSGDVDYQLGNLDLEGDAEIEGSVKSRFKIEATGDVVIGGTVERGAKITAGGNVVVKGGIIGAKARAGGSLYTRFIQDSEIEVGLGLMVRNYVQDSDIQVGGKATIQGNEGGERKLCVLGGSLLAASEIDAVSVGSAYGRKTQVIAGIDPELEARAEKYRKGLAFSDLRSRRAMRGLQNVASGTTLKKEHLVQAIRKSPPGRRDFLVRQLKELETMQKLKASLEHHIEEVEQQREQVAEHGFIRVPGSAFQRVTVRVGRVYKELEKEVRAVKFHLNREANQIAQEVIAG